MTRKNICWVTPDCFLDVDLPIVPHLLDKFDIHWIILFDQRDNRFSEKDILKYQSENLSVSFLRNKYRKRDFRTISFYKSLKRQIKSINPDLIYCNSNIGSPFMIPFWLWLQRQNVIVTAHQGAVHEGFDHKTIYKILFKLSYRNINYVHMFSPSQARLFHANFPKAHVFQSFLGLKSLGQASVQRTWDKDKIHFLVFGTINKTKHIDLLIDAACNIYESGYKNFDISINGKCDNWDFYQNHIRYPELFKLDIRSIDNGEIPNLFTSANYLVQPYRVVSQSGPLKLAYNYNLPVIVSDLPGFTDEVKENVTGHIFKHNDVKDLERVLTEVLKKTRNEYDSLLLSMKSYVDKNYSEEAQKNFYISMINSCINN